MFHSTNETETSDNEIFGNFIYLKECILISSDMCHTLYSGNGATLKGLSMTIKRLSKHHDGQVVTIQACSNCMDNGLVVVGTYKHIAQSQSFGLERVGKDLAIFSRDEWQVVKVVGGPAVYKSYTEAFNSQGC